MASIGLSKPIIAKYSAEGTKVTYTDVMVAGKAVKLDMELEDQGTNILYGDNGPAEVCNDFGGGNITLGTTELSPDAMAKILGVTTEKQNDVDWTLFNDNQTTPYVGLGAVAKKQIDGAVKWVAIVYPKIQFKNFGESLTTQGETIEWKTPEIKATLMRDDTEKHEWRRISSPLETEAAAEAAIRAFFNKTA